MYNYGKEAYRFLEQLSFPRTSGSAEELRAAEMIAARVRELGAEPVMEEFEVRQNRPVQAEFRVTEPVEKTVTVTGMINAGETAPEGMEAELLYLRAIDEITLPTVKDKLVLLASRPNEKEYKQLKEAGIVGMLIMNGTMRDTPETVDLDTMRFREVYDAYGKVPAFAIRMSDAIELVRENASKVHVTLRLEEQVRTSRNVVVEIPGTDLADDILVCGGHYDSTEFSCGAWDNGAGVVHLLSLLAHLKEHPPRRTVRVIFFGSEEVGLKGSGAYVRAHADELCRIRYMINTDVGGSILGQNILMSTGVADAEGYFHGLQCEAAYSARLSSGVMSSDSAVFSDFGIPSVSMGQFPPTGAGYMHTRYDNFSRISEEVLAEEIRFLLFLVDRLANVPIFPIPRVIPKDMRTKLVDYFGKERSNTAKQTEFPEEPEARKPMF